MAIDSTLESDLRKAMDMRDDLESRGELSRIRFQNQRGNFESRLTTELMRPYGLVLKRDFMYFCNPDMGEPIQIEICGPPGLSYDYLSMLDAMVSGGIDSSGSRILKIDRRDQDQELAQYDKLKLMTRYILSVPTNGIDLRPKVKYDPIQEDKVWQMQNKLLRNGCLIRTTNTIKKSIRKGQYEVEALSRIGMSVGWDWDATGTDEGDTVTLHLTVPNGMAGYYIKVFIDMENGGNSIESTLQKN